MKQAKGFPYGAVYFRKSNPPAQDWERDYATAAADGMNIFRHWVLWGAVETAPGRFDWADYDRQLELGGQNGIGTVLAEIIHAAPEWVYSRHSDLLLRDLEGRPAHSGMGVSSATGGFARGSGGALCLDHPESRELAGRFLREMALRYRGHPALLGYDVWNECNYAPDTCTCESTRQAFIQWLREKYGSLETLNTAWRRYSYAAWEDVQIPRDRQPYREHMDWLGFKKDNFYRQMEWRIDILRRADPDCLIAAHGVGSTISHAAVGCDEWRAAQPVDVYGYTWVASRHTADPWELFCAVDQTRAGAGDKPIWHAEAQGGPLWLQPQVLGRPAEDGRVTTPEDLRIWNMTSFAGGARGLLFPRWRPLLDGPLFGAFGPYGMDGSRTPRSEMASSIAQWANRQPQEELWKAVPVAGEVGIPLLEESQLFDGLLTGEGYYADCVRGAYRGFFDSNLQADFVRWGGIARYRILYLPYPILMERQAVETLAEWVKAGGTLICEGCASYFGETCSVDPVQPGQGMDALLGVRQQDVAFMPDISGDLFFTLCETGERVEGGLYRQSFEPGAAHVTGVWPDGSAAMTTHTLGKGRAIALGTFPSYARQQGCAQTNAAFFAALPGLAGVEPHVRVSTAQVTARLHADGERLYLWLLNNGPVAADCTVTLSGKYGGLELRHTFWGEALEQTGSHTFQADIPQKDAVVSRIR